MDGILERACAKLNLGLAVRGRRPDGYHELHTLFATVDVCDEVRLRPEGRGVTLTVGGEFEAPQGPENLAWRAAEAYLEAADAPGGVAVRLEKRVPAGAGLGGGSADAAAVLRGLAKIYPAEIDLEALARELGADVPFLLRGGLAEGRGAGEELAFLEPLEAHFVLVRPPFEVPTAAAYAALEPRDFGGDLDVGGILDALRRGAPPPWRNDLERAVFFAYPPLADLKRLLEEHGLAGALMSGSGSTLFAPVESREKAERYADALARRYPGFWVRAASLTPGEGA
ncbi:MAG TPA: 4-(cytidine 5'-diphospho)-2-C-methyl-D-erythritol kinase [Oceanithermus profundus]|uniref:4-diphosphocytidyl-2-C-methyl-D-erythritol kinase n=1 Tax=Oceanithermus profundus TaxID=187137 RepID=A0A7C4ZFL6_9DEIN|nr:4-(cytidine 5'-diphospho)-2-C-methyl-D-erythritol kinase [Oceanithermus profundus]